MHDSDAARLAELHRQRKLVQEHLAWLDEQIAQATPSAGAVAGGGRVEPIATPTANSAAQEAATQGTTTQPLVAATTDTAMDAELDRYRRPASDLQRDVRMGCLLYFAAGLLMTAAIVAILYFALRHP
jgi:hypothetical protein